jgi:hypothetical protein
MSYFSVNVESFCLNTIPDHSGKEKFKLDLFISIQQKPKKVKVHILLRPLK